MSAMNFRRKKKAEDSGFALPELDEIALPKIGSDEVSEPTVDTAVKNTASAEAFLSRRAAREAPAEESTTPTSGSSKSKLPRNSKEPKAKKAKKEKPVKVAMTRKEKRQAAEEAKAAKAAEAALKEKQKFKLSDLRTLTFADIKKKFSKGMKLSPVPFADMVPVSYREAREAREARRSWIKIGVGSILVVGLFTAGAITLRIYEQGLYDATVNSQAGVNFQLNELQDVSTVVDARDELLRIQQQAAAGEISWANTFGLVQSAIPEGTAITSVSVTTGSASGEGVPAAGLVLNLTSTDAQAYSTALQAISSVEGVAGAQISNLSSSGSNYSYTVGFTFGSNTLTNRFTPPAPEEAQE